MGFDNWASFPTGGLCWITLRVRGVMQNCQEVQPLRVSCPMVNPLSAITAIIRPLKKCDLYKLGQVPDRNEHRVSQSIVKKIQTQSIVKNSAND